MDTFTTFKDELGQINQDMQSLFAGAKTIPGMSEDSFKKWEKACKGLRRQLAEEVIRVAVVGPLKSGKSTVLNSLLRGDFLKRGAGVVTSIITRIRAGTRLEATLHFKSWEEVNADMEQALALFPTLDKPSEGATFDIRRQPARQQLWNALKSLGSEQLITRDTRNVYNVLLSSYLKGYDTVCDIIVADTIRHYTDDQFAAHKEFVGNETLAVYLKDVELKIKSFDLEANLELADCQGSDSSNPLHLAMIQDYLLLTNLIIYVISSRTGLRRADIRFLSMIKKIGILDNILFVINCDFNEHESINDLNNLIKKVHEELSMIKSEPEIYTFSALFNLFRFIAHDLSKKDKARLYQWEADSDLAAFSGRQTARFESALKEKLTRWRSSLLLNNHLERLCVILSGLDNWLGINQKILTRNSQSAQQIIKRLEGHHQRLRQIKSLINTTVSGAKTKLKQQSSADVNRFFEMHAGNITGKLVKFIKNYRKMPRISEEKIDLAVFSKTMYSAFQDFRQSLDAYIAEVINPEVIGFIKQKEKEIQDNIEKLIDPYDVMLTDVYNEYHRLMERFGLSAKLEGRPEIQLADMEALIQHAGLRPPKIVATMRYSGGIKTAAIVHFGFHNLQRNFKKLLKKSVKERAEVVHGALQGGARQMKRETLKSVVANLKDYCENLKFGYFSILIDTTASSLEETLVERFQVYFNDLSTVVGQISHTKVDKERAFKILKEMEVKSNQLKNRVERLKEKIEGVG